MGPPKDMRKNNGVSLINLLGLMTVLVLPSMVWAGCGDPGEPEIALNGSGNRWACNYEQHLVYEETVDKGTGQD